MIILGLNAFHADSSACILRDGKLIAAAEEERFRRIKHWAGFPAQAIAYCLAEAKLRLADVEHVALNQDGGAARWQRLSYVATHPPDPRLIIDRLRARRARAGVPELLDAAFAGERFRGAVHAVEHHMAHLSSAFHVSPFLEAALVSVDGFGDFSSAAWGIGRGAEVTIDGRVHFPHSLGIFYQALTQYLGFPYYGDEYKVMGLAPYASERETARLAEVFESYLGLSQKNPLIFERKIPESTYFIYRRLQRDFESERFDNVAGGLQAFTEKLVIRWIRAAVESTGIKRVALAGGVFMNVKVNKLIAGLPAA